MGTAVIIEAARTPIGKRGGALAGLHPAEPRRCATHQTGAARRSSASSRAGTPAV